MNAQKIGGVIVMLLGVPLGMMASDRYLASVAACLGLQMIFFAKERIHDERVQSLKMKAMFTAMSVGMAVMLVANHYLFVFLRQNLNSMPPEMNIWEGLAGIVLIALGLFHYWRWQDGRQMPDEDPKTAKH